MTDLHLLPVFDIATIPETGCLDAVAEWGRPTASSSRP